MAHPTNKHERVLLCKNDRGKDSILNSNHQIQAFLKRATTKKYKNKLVQGLYFFYIQCVWISKTTKRGLNMYIHKGSFKNYKNMCGLGSTVRNFYF